MSVLFPLPYLAPSPTSAAQPFPAYPSPTPTLISMPNSPFSGQSPMMIPIRWGRRYGIMPASVIGSPVVSGFPGVGSAAFGFAPGSAKYAYPRPIKTADVSKAWFLGSALLGTLNDLWLVSTAGVTQAGTVTNWADQGPNGNDAVGIGGGASPPTYNAADAVLNGKPSATFGANDFMTIALAGGTIPNGGIVLGMVAYLAALPALGATTRLLDGAGGTLFVDVDHTGQILLSAGVALTTPRVKVTAGKPFALVVSIGNTKYTTNVHLNSARGNPMGAAGAGASTVASLVLGNDAGKTKGGATIAEVRTYWAPAAGPLLPATFIAEASTRYKLGAITV